MTNATHTQGPWAATTRTGEGLTPATYVIEDADRLPVVMAWRAADARLIAAAPDLLAALEQCLPIIDAHRRTALGEGDIAAMNARAAIAKAKGN